MAYDGIVPLYTYQKTWLQDKSRFKIGMFARQSGKTFACTLEIVQAVLFAEAAGQISDWLVVSSSDRQSQNAVRQIKKHFRAMKIFMKSRGIKYLENRDETKHEVTLPNGSCITAVAANPDTIRGDGSNVYADEFAFHDDSDRMWRALFPIVSNGFRLLVSSTPNGKGNRFYRLMTDADNGWSKHRVDIYDAIRQGLLRNAEEMKRHLGDPEGWAQEYELHWLDEATSWLPYSMIAACECDNLGKYLGKVGSNPCYVGIDIGRRQDLFVLWVLEKQGDVFYQRELIAEKGISFAVQESFFADVMRKYRPTRVCIDQTGMGEQFTERAKEYYGSYTVEGILFSNLTKLDLANGLRRNFEERLLRIYAGDRVLRDDLHSLKRTVTSAGNVRFAADRNENGHADRAWALALALHAGQTESQPFEYETVESDEWANNISWI